MSWIQGIPVVELHRKQKAVVRHGAKQIALLHLQDKIWAVDNRCPHEGYPLSEGTINPDTCVLTCNWHNWKFDLNTGDNITGEDRLNVYETRIECDHIWIHIPEVNKQQVEQRILLQFEKAFRDQSYDRMARELARVHYNNIDPMPLVRKSVAWSHDKLEYGMGHSFAVLADWLTLASESQGPEQRLICLLEAVDYMAETALRQQAYEYSSGRIPFTEDGFVLAIEQEDEDTAVAMVLHALDSGMHYSDLERGLTRAALSHYHDFGHSLIYVLKAGEVIAHLGSEVEPFLIPALVRSILNAYREDLLPEFRSLGRYVAAWNENGGSETECNAEELFGRSVEYLLRWTVAQSGHSTPQQIYAALLETGARHLLHCDLALQFRYDLSVSKNIGWLDFTHAVTFGNAVRRQCTKFPDLWKNGLLQMACFAGRNSEHLDASVVDSDWLVPDEARFYEKSIELLLDHGRSMPIIAAHLVKTFVAVRNEFPLASADCRKYLLASVNRFLHSPLREKHVRRTMRQALELIGREF